MQGTVADREPGRAGELLTDDGTRLRFGWDAVQQPVRHLRAGQRVHARVEDGAVVALTLLTLALPPARSPGCGSMGG